MMATPGVGPTTIVSPPPGYGAYHHIPMSGHRPQPQPIFKQTAHLQVESVTYRLRVFLDNGKY